MPRLDCSATNCRYNENHGCVRGNISVKGAGAGKACETCCDSFEERRGNALTNSVREPSEHVNIHCEAEKCLHNDKCNCRADQVGVNGPGACSCEQTACGTFHAK